MKLFLISQSYITGYGTYDSAVVTAGDEEAASKIAPGRGGSWTSPEHVAVEYIGAAKPGTKAGEVVCASFNAG